MAILAAGFLLVPSPATASSMLSDWLTVYNDKGTPVFSVSATEDQESDHPGQLFYISPDDVSSFSDAANVYLCDPSGKISDVFGIFKLDDSKGWSNGSNGWNSTSDSNDQYVLGFISDPADFDSKQCGKSFTCVPEAKGVFSGNATQFLSDKLTDKGYTATFFSDSDVVPEPAATGLLFGIGALGLCIWKRRTVA